MSRSKRIIFGTCIILALLVVFVGGAFLVNPSLFTQIQDALSGKPHPGTCLILEEKYCKTVTFIPYNIYSPGFIGKKIAVYKLPPGTPIFAPTDGDLSPATVPYKDSSGQITKQGGFILNEVAHSQRTQDLDHIYGFLYDGAPYISLPIRKGTIIGRIASDKNIPYSGNYNFAVTLARQVAYLVYGQHGNHNTPTQPIVEEASQELEKILAPK